MNWLLNHKLQDDLNKIYLWVEWNIFYKNKIEVLRYGLNVQSGASSLSPSGSIIPIRSYVKELGVTMNANA